MNGTTPRWLQGSALTTRCKETDAMTRAVGYLRVSTGLQAEKGMGLEIQRERVSEYAQAQGLELVDVVQEVASGGVRNGEEASWEHRPVLLTLLDRDDFDVLIVARYDRLSRDVASLVFIERKLSKRDAHVASVAEENGDGPIGRLMRNTLANFAEYERDVIRERLNAGKARGKQTGRHVHGQIPFGYRSLGRGELEPDPSAAAIVKRIYQASKAGDGPSRIAKGLNAERLLSARGGRWSRQAVTAILRNPAYKGARYNVRDAHPRIVSVQLWNRVNGTSRI